MLAAASLLLAGAAACSDEAELDQGPSTPARLATTPATTPTANWELASIAPAASGSADEPAVEGYIAFRIAAYEALERLDRSYEPLLQTSAGEQLQYAQSVIDRYVSEGWETRGKARWSVVAANPAADGRVAVSACQWDSAAWAVDRDGKIVAPVADRWLPLVTTMENVNGIWVATSSQEEDVPCELAQ